MKNRSNKYFKTFSLGIALWLVFLSASVHALHNHPAVACESNGGGSLLHCLQGDTPLFVPQYQPDISDKNDPTTQVGGLCPVCLFLAKTMAERPAVPPGPASRDGESGFAICRAPLSVTSLDRLTSVPRAPPGGGSN